MRSARALTRRSPDAGGREEGSQQADDKWMYCARRLIRKGIFLHQSTENSRMNSLLFCEMNSFSAQPCHRQEGNKLGREQQVKLHDRAYVQH